MPYYNLNRAQAKQRSKKLHEEAEAAVLTLWGHLEAVLTAWPAWPQFLEDRGLSGCSFRGLQNYITYRLGLRDDGQLYIQVCLGQADADAMVVSLGQMEERELPRYKVLAVGHPANRRHAAVWAALPTGVNINKLIRHMDNAREAMQEVQEAERPAAANADPVLGALFAKLAVRAQ